MLLPRPCRSSAPIGPYPLSCAALATVHSFDSLGRWLVILDWPLFSGYGFFDSRGYSVAYDEGTAENFKTASLHNVLPPPQCFLSSYSHRNADLCKGANAVRCYDIWVVLRFGWFRRVRLRALRLHNRFSQFRCGYDLKCFKVGNVGYEGRRNLCLHSFIVEVVDPRIRRNVG